MSTQEKDVLNSLPVFYQIKDEFYVLKYGVIPKDSILMTLISPKCAKGEPDESELIATLKKREIIVIKNPKLNTATVKMIMDLLPRLTEDPIPRLELSLSKIYHYRYACDYLQLYNQKNNFVPYMCENKIYHVTGYCNNQLVKHGMIFPVQPDSERPGYFQLSVSLIIKRKQKLDLTHICGLYDYNIRNLSFGGGHSSYGWWIPIPEHNLLITLIPKIYDNKNIITIVSDDWEKKYVDADQMVALDRKIDFESDPVKIKLI